MKNNVGDIRDLGPLGKFIICEEEVTFKSGNVHTVKVLKPYKISETSNTNSACLEKLRGGKSE